MVKFNSEHEARVLEACTFTRTQKKPNLKAIARKFNVSYNVLRNRRNRGFQALNGPKFKNRLLKPYQEEALMTVVTEMRDMNVPIPHAMVTELANDALQREGLDYQVGRNWAYEFEKRRQKHLESAPKTQNIKDHTRIQTPDAPEASHCDDFDKSSSPEPSSGSSSIASTPPKDIKSLHRNHQKILRSIEQSNTQLTSNLSKIFTHNVQMMEEQRWLREQLAIQKDRILDMFSTEQRSITP